MNSQVWLSNKELQSVAVLHPSVPGSDIKRFITGTLSQMKNAGFSFLHNTWGKFPEIIALIQRRESEEIRRHCVPPRHNKHCAKPHAVSVISIPPFGYHTGNHGSPCTLSSSWTVMWNQGIIFLCFSQNKGGKRTIKIHFTVFDLLALRCNSLGLVVWTAASHGFLLARSRACSLLEHRKRRCVVSHMPHMSRPEDASELFNNALMDRTTGNPLS